MLYTRPIVVAVHPNLVDELKQRRDLMEKETGRKTKGGITCFSEMAAFELMLLRASGENIMREILNLDNIPIHKCFENGIEKEFVPYEIFKKLYIYSSALNKKKDIKQIKVEVSKIKGMKKNEIKYLF